MTNHPTRSRTNRAASAFVRQDDFICGRVPADEMEPFLAIARQQLATVTERVDVRKDGYFVVPPHQGWQIKNNKRVWADIPGVWRDIPEWTPTTLDHRDRPCPRYVLERAVSALVAAGWRLQENRQLNGDELCRQSPAGTQAQFTAGWITWQWQAYSLDHGEPRQVTAATSEEAERLLTDAILHTAASLYAGGDTVIGLTARDRQAARAGDWDNMD